MKNTNNTIINTNTNNTTNNTTNTNTTSTSQKIENKEKTVNNSYDLEIDQIQKMTKLYTLLQDVMLDKPKDSIISQIKDLIKLHQNFI